MTNAQRDIKRKLRVFAYAEEIGNVSKACRYFGVSRETFYKWKRSYAARGDDGLINSKPCPENPKLRTPAHIEEKQVMWTFTLVIYICNITLTACEIDKQIMRVMQKAMKYIVWDGVFFF
jgi:transposase